MSLFHIRHKFFSLGPRAKRKGDLIYIRKSFILCLLTLFTNLQTVIINKKQKYLLVARRRYYFFGSLKKIRFKDIAYLDYRFHELGTSWGLAFNKYFLRPLDSFEWFIVSIVTHQNESFEIAKFFGEGVFSTGFWGVVFLEDGLFDFSGTQEEDSRALLEELAKLFGVSVGKPYPS